MDSLQPLSSDSATLAMQQAMLGGGEDSMDGSEEEEDDDEEEEGMEEEEDEEEEEERARGRQLHSAGVRDLGLEDNEGMEWGEMKKRRGRERQSRTRAITLATLHEHSTHSHTQLATYPSISHTLT